MIAVPQITLLAVYPSYLIDEVEKILISSKPEMKKIIDAKAIKYLKQWGSVRSNSRLIDFGKIGEIAGGFAKAFLND